MVVILVVLMTAIASFVVVLRASIEEEQIDPSKLNSAGIVDDQVQLTGISKENVQFLLGYLVEFPLTMLVYYPTCSFILFTGVLGWGVLPIVGGRPREIMLEQKELERRKLEQEDA